MKATGADLPIVPGQDHEPPAHGDEQVPQAPVAPDLEAAETAAIVSQFAKSPCLLIQDEDGFEVQRSGCRLGRATNLVELRQLLADWVGDAA